MNLREYFEACATHDGSWRYSSDNRYDGPYHRGQRREARLLHLATTGGFYKRCWAAWCDYRAGKRSRPEEFEFDFEDAI